MVQNQVLSSKKMKLSASCKNQFNQVIKTSSDSEEDEDDELNFQNNNYFQRRFLPARSSDILQTVYKGEDKEKLGLTQSSKFLLLPNYEWQQQQQYTQNEQRLLQTYQNNINNFSQNRKPSISALFENEVINSRITESRSNHNKSQNTPKSLFKNFQDYDFGVMSVDASNKNKYRDLHKIERQINFNNKILSDKTNSFHFKKGQESKQQIISLNIQSPTQNTQQQAPLIQGLNIIKSSSSMNLSPQNIPVQEENSQFCNLNQAIFNSLQNSQTNSSQNDVQKQQQFSSPQYQKQISYTQGFRKMSLECSNKNQEKIIIKDEENQISESQKSNKNINNNELLDTQGDIQLNNNDFINQKIVNQQNSSSQAQIKQLNKQLSQKNIAQQIKNNKQQGILHPQKQIQNYYQQQQALQFYHQQYNKSSNYKIINHKKMEEQNRHQFIMQYESIMNQFYGKKEQKQNLLSNNQKQIIEAINSNQTNDLKQSNPQQDANMQNQQKINSKPVRMQYIEQIQQEEVVQSQRIYDKLSQQKNSTQSINQSSQNPVEQVNDCIKTPKNIPKQIKNEVFDLSLNDFSLQSQKSLSSSVKNSKSKNIRTIFSVIKTNSSKGDKKIEYNNIQDIFKQNMAIKQNKNQGLTYSQHKNEMDCLSNKIDSNNILVEDQFSQENQLKCTLNKQFKNYFHQSSINNKIKQKEKLFKSYSNQTNKYNLFFQTNMEQTQDKYILNSPTNNQNLTDRSQNQISTLRLNTDNPTTKSNNISEMIINSTFMNGSNFTVIDLQSKKDQKSQLNEDSNLLMHLENRFNRKQSFLQSNLKLITSQSCNSPSSTSALSKFQSSNKINLKLNQNVKSSQNQQVRESLSQNNMLSQVNKNQTNLSPKNISQEDLQKMQSLKTQNFDQKNKINISQLNKFSQILNTQNPILDLQTKNNYLDSILDQKQQNSNQKVAQQYQSKHQTKEINFSLLSKTDQQLLHS